jgi:hypothetical protein
MTTAWEAPADRAGRQQDPVEPAGLRAVLGRRLTAGNTCATKGHGGHLRRIVRPASGGRLRMRSISVEGVSVAGEEWALAASVVFSGLWSGLVGMLTLVMHPMLAAMDGRDFGSTGSKPRRPGRRSPCFWWLWSPSRRPRSPDPDAAALGRVTSTNDRIVPMPSSRIVVRRPVNIAQAIRGGMPSSVCLASGRRSWRGPAETHTCVGRSTRCACEARDAPDAREGSHRRNLADSRSDETGLDLSLFLGARIAS